TETTEKTGANPEPYWRGTSFADVGRHRGGSRRLRGSRVTNHESPVTSHPSRPLVQEVAHSGEHHRQTQAVRRRNDVRVAHRAARLDHRGRPGLRRFLHAIGKRKERVGSHYA